MSLAPIPTLDELARSPARARDLSPEAARDLLARLTGLLGAWVEPTRRSRRQGEAS